MLRDELKPRNPTAAGSFGHPALGKDLAILPCVVSYPQFSGVCLSFVFFLFLAFQSRSSSEG